jgi:hypothetical protein
VDADCVSQMRDPQIAVVNKIARIPCGELTWREIGRAVFIPRGSEAPAFDRTCCEYVG